MNGVTAIDKRDGRGERTIPFIVLYIPQFCYRLFLCWSFC
jgi:hypothetical protein